MKSFLVIVLIFVQLIPIFSNVVKDISYDVDGVKEYALLSIPNSPKPENGYPVIVIIHGYIPPPYYSTQNSYKGVFNRYADSEFLIIKPDLIGHGRSEKGSNYNYNTIKLQYPRDITATLDHLESEELIDRENIFVMGHSNGGDTTLRLLVDNPKLFKAASLWAPVTVTVEESSFFFRENGREKYGMRALESKEAKSYVESVKEEWGIPDSARYLNFLDRIITPVTIRHADTERVVPYYWSEELLKSVRSVNPNLSIELINYPGDDHNLARNQRAVISTDLEWFRNFLGK